MAGSGSFLAVSFHAGLPYPCGQQVRDSLILRAECAPPHCTKHIAHCTLAHLQLIYLREQMHARHQNACRSSLTLLFPLSPFFAEPSLVGHGVDPTTGSHVILPAPAQDCPPVTSTPLPLLSPLMAGLLHLPLFSFFIHPLSALPSPHRSHTRLQGTPLLGAASIVLHCIAINIPLSLPPQLCTHRGRRGWSTYTNDVQSWSYD